MADINALGGTFGTYREIAALDVSRVYDSCSGREVQENLRVFIPAESEALLEEVSTARVRSVEVVHTDIDITPITFNRGFFALDIIFYADVLFEMNLRPVPTGPLTAVPHHGLSIFEKKVILFGSEGGASIFTSVAGSRGAEVSSSLPTATVQISNPLVLAHRLVDNQEAVPSSPGALPDAVAARFGAFAPGVPRRALYTTLGLFAVTQLSRRVQVFVPSFDFGLEGNPCSATSETPAELFARVPFPLEAFSPPQVPDSGPLFTAENFREDDIAGLPSISGDFSQGQQSK